MKGKHLSKETKLKISKSLNGNVPWNKGKTNVYSKESLLKMSESHTGKHHTEESKQLISQKNACYWKGKKRSDKTLLKMSQNLTKYHISKEELVQLYINEHKTQKEIALIYGCNRATIGYKLKKYNIKNKLLFFFFLFLF